MDSLTSIRSTIKTALEQSSYVTEYTIEEVGNDISVHYRLPEATLSSFEVRNQFARGHSSTDKYELVNGSLIVPASDNFDEENPFESADKFAKEIYENADFTGRVSPPSSAAAPDMDEGRMISIPHKNHGPDIESYLSWIEAAAEVVYGD